MQPGSSTSKHDRKAVERKRRMQMKHLSTRLASLISNQPSNSKERLPQRDMLDQATKYIVQVRKNVEELKRRKEELIKGKGSDESSSANNTNKDEIANSVKPVFTLRDMGSSLEVNLITGLNNNNNNNNNNFMLSEVLRVLEEEGADVVNASYSTVGEKIFCTIHSKPLYSRIGIETSRVHERLKILFP